MRKLLASKGFKKKLNKQYANDFKLHTRINKQLSLLRQYDNHPSLRLHKLSGLDNVWSMSVNMSIRIIFSYYDDKIFLIDIGTHDEVY